jgi:hypothetical protein
MCMEASPAITQKNFHAVTPVTHGTPLHENEDRVQVANVVLPLWPLKS